MLKTKMKYIVPLFLILNSCNQNHHFEEYIGTWQQVGATHRNNALISRIQIMKLEEFYIVGIEYSYHDNLFFYVCEKEKDHFLISPGKYLDQNDEQDYVLTEPTKIYFDAEFRKIYLSNMIFKDCPRPIFQFANNELSIISQDK